MTRKTYATGEREVAAELALRDGPDDSHFFTVSGSVMRRKTSSSSPRSLYMPSTFQPSQVDEVDHVLRELPRARLVLGIDAEGAVQVSRRGPARDEPLRGRAARLHGDRAVQLRHRAQLLGRAVGDDPAAVDDDRARAGGVDFLEDVGRKDDRLLLPELADQVAHLVLLVRIEAVGGLVHDQHLGIVDQRLREAGAVPVALGKRVDRLVQHRLEEAQLHYAVHAPLRRSLPESPRSSAAKLRNPCTVMSA